METSVAERAGLKSLLLRQENLIRSVKRHLIVVVPVLPTVLICFLSRVATGHELRQSVPAGADVNSPAGKYNL